MALSITITQNPNATFVDDEPVTLAMLRAAATPSVSISGTVGSGDITPGAITNTEISSTAAITFSKLENLAQGNILLGSAANVATETAVTDGTILLGNASNQGVLVTPSGDVTITNAGVTALQPSAITGQDDNTTPVATDTLLLCDDPAGTAALNEIAISDLRTLFNPSRCHIQETTAFTTLTNNATKSLTISAGADISDPDSVLTLDDANNEFVLAAGTYVADIRIPTVFTSSGSETATARAFLYNKTGAATVLEGTAMSSYFTNAGSESAFLYITGRFTIAASQDLDIRVECGNHTGLTTRQAGVTFTGDSPVLWDAVFTKEF